MSPARTTLLEILRETRRLLALPSNDFSWSSWEDTDHATAELDGLISDIENGQPVDTFTLSVLFTATGPIQETGLSSGWSDAFLALADRFDAAIAQDGLA